MSHRGEPVKKDPKPPGKRRESPVIPLLAGAVIAAVILLGYLLLFYH